MSIVKKIYTCQMCNFNTTIKHNYNAHLSTKKHINNKDKIEKKLSQKDLSKKYNCECGKSYTYPQGLYRHKRTCDFVQKKDTENSIISYTDNSQNSFTITELLKKIDEKDKELKEKDNTIKDMIPKIGNNNNNKQFNINIFLNEDCKDAINMSDFIKSIKVSAEQLEYTTKNGLQKGLSNVILENMNKLSLNERPVHCTDTRRDTLYIKDNDVWEKDNDKTKIKEAINKVSSRNYNALSNWSKDNPDFMENDKKQDFYAKTITTIGKKVDDNKIIKNVSKETYIDIKNI